MKIINISFFLLLISLKSVVAVNSKSALKVCFYHVKFVKWNDTALINTINGYKGDSLAFEIVKKQAQPMLLKSDFENHIIENYCEASIDSTSYELSFSDHFCVYSNNNSIVEWHPLNDYKYLLRKTIIDKNIKLDTLSLKTALVYYINEKKFSIFKFESFSKSMDNDVCYYYSKEYGIIYYKSKLNMCFSKLHIENDKYLRNLLDVIMNSE